MQSAGVNLFKRAVQRALSRRASVVLLFAVGGVLECPWPGPPGFPLGPKRSHLSIHVGYLWRKRSLYSSTVNLSTYDVVKS